MRPPSAHAERQRQRITRLFEKGLTDQEMAKALGFARQTIIKYRTQLGLLRIRGRTRGRPHGPANIERLARISELRDQGLSYAEIGRTLGISRQAVHGYVRRWEGE